jgi:hypothetical protein
MRELTLLETGSLAGMVLLSLVLPLLMSVGGAQAAAARKPCSRTVWMGQTLGAIAGLAVLASASIAPFATAFGVMSCIGCALVPLRQFRAASPA